jgi:hypothetical protein
MDNTALATLEKNYSPKEKMPLGWYALATIAFNATLFVIVQQEKKEEQISNQDLILAGLATHKLSRIITKDAVTSFFRAPFTRYEEPLGYGELNESPRKEGFSGVVGEILNCNYCMSVWVGMGIFWGLGRYPRQTRFLNQLFSSITISDFLHVLYEEKRTHSNVLTLQEEKLDRKQAA